MTVGELIEELQRYNKNLKVALETKEGITSTFNTYYLDLGEQFIDYCCCKKDDFRPYEVIVVIGRDKLIP